MKIVTPAQMKLLEATADKNGTSYEKLMRNAGKLLAKEVIKHINHKRSKILFLCGNGNNAGDCFVSSNILSKHYDVEVAMLCDEPKTELSRKVFLEISKEVKITYDIINIKKSLKECDILCDGIFGTGFHGQLSIDIQEILSTPTKAIKIAVDVPSGVDCNTGEVSKGTILADSTVTFAYTKLGMILHPANKHCGTIKVVDIGITKNDYSSCIDNYIQLLDRHQISLPHRSDNGNKGTFGKLLNITGSKNMLGACIMSSKAALRCGIGLLSICTENNELLPLSMPEPIYVDRNIKSISTAMKKNNAILIGCGLGTSKETLEMFTNIVKKSECPIIIDADGLNILSKCIDIIKDKNIIVTPHPMEMARLTNLSVHEVQSNRLKIAINFAKENHCVVILKGAGTIITNGKHSFIDPTANSGMSKGGSGDVLAGMVSSFIAQGIDILEACKLSVYIHSQAGLNCAKRLSKFSMLPTDIIDEIPNVIKSI